MEGPDNKLKLMLDLVINQFILSKSLGSSRVSLPSVKLVLANIKPVLLQDRSLVEVSGDVTLVGDLHGQMEDLTRALSLGGISQNSKYVFLGDYVDRGKESLEVMTFLYALKIQYPENIVLLRGNHESASQSEIGGFLHECQTKASRQIWEEFCETFDYLPFAALVNKSIFCVHGGISPQLEFLNQIREIQRPCQIPMRGLITDLCWSDPDPKVFNFGPNVRGQTYTWGKGAADKFMARNRIHMIVRGHQVAPNGYNFPFHDKSVVTLFSAEKKGPYLANKSCIMKVTKLNSYSFIELNDSVPKLSLMTTSKSTESLLSVTSESTSKPVAKPASQHGTRKSSVPAKKTTKLLDKEHQNTVKTGNLPLHTKTTDDLPQQLTRKSTQPVFNKGQLTIDTALVPKDIKEAPKSAGSRPDSTRMRKPPLPPKPNTPTSLKAKNPTAAVAPVTKKVIAPPVAGRRRSNSVAGQL